MTTMHVLDPTARTEIPSRTGAPPLDSLRGKRVGYHHARGPYLGVLAFAEEVGELLIRDYAASEFVRVKSVVDNPAAAEAGASGWSDPKLRDIVRRLYDQYANEVDCVIVGAGFCGGSTYWSIQGACEFQDRGIPTVSLTCPAFESLALYSCQARGYDKIPMLILGDDFETKRESELRAIAATRADEVASLLTRETIVSQAV